jgi:hypothetical protein
MLLVSRFPDCKISVANKLLELNKFTLWQPPQPPDFTVILRPVTRHSAVVIIISALFSGGPSHSIQTYK